VICSFWVAHALARLGRIAQARQVLSGVMSGSNGLGLFSEHFIPATQTQSGNFPQAYSHVGLINAAFAASPSWNEVL
jgi:GH15 family glucan-1,4-alpha-glucosidase